jgi:hypothetical protein
MVAVQQAVVDLNLLPLQRALGELGVCIVADDPHCFLSPDLCLLFNQLLPQFNDTSPFVAAATAALGAAYEAHVLRQGDLEACHRSHEMYLTALRAIQHEIGSSQPRLVPILVASALLAAHALLASRRKDAFVHTQLICCLFSPGTSVREQCIEEIKAMKGNVSTLEHLLKSFEHQAFLFSQQLLPAQQR